MRALTIGRVAQEAGVNLQTVRYYQRCGLIREPDKPEEGYRVYDAEVVQRLRFVKRAQLLGFTLKEIRELLEFGDGHCRDVQSLAKVKRDGIHQQIQDLRRMQKVLDRYLKECDANPDPGHCLMIDALSAGAAADVGSGGASKRRSSEPRNRMT